jgi:hypothetical protein
MSEIADIAGVLLMVASKWPCPEDVANPQIMKKGSGMMSVRFDWRGARYQVSRNTDTSEGLVFFFVEELQGRCLVHSNTCTFAERLINDV